MNLLFKIPSSC